MKRPFPEGGKSFRLSWGFLLKMVLNLCFLTFSWWVIFSADCLELLPLRNLK